MSNDAEEKATHTPGPWEFDKGDFVRTKTPDFRSCKLICEVGDYENWEYNARLIAAAPDFLVGAERLLESFADAVNRSGSVEDIKTNMGMLSGMQRLAKAVDSAKGTDRGKGQLEALYGLPAPNAGETSPISSPDRITNRCNMIEDNAEDAE